MTDDDHLYRRGVGIMLLNPEGKVLVGARIDNPDDAWQMPQGGLDECEEPWDCALRELEEETGIGPHFVERIACSREELRYRLPDELIGKIWQEGWHGQRQWWFLCRFLGTDADIDIHGVAHPEFRDWRWVEPRRLPDLIVPFKRELYGQILDEFEAHL